MWNYGNELYSSIDRRLFPSSEEDSSEEDREDQEDKIENGEK